MPLPDLSPSTAARKALADFDTNQDGTLDANELKNCPGLAQSSNTIDKDGDGRLSEEEIRGRLASLLDMKIGLASVPCKVMMHGEPMAGANVTLVPENFLQPALKSALGVSDTGGMVVLRIEGESLAGVAIGFYRVEVSLKNAHGEETLPARYNTKTSLGQEIPPPQREGIVLNLTSDD